MDAPKCKLCGERHYGLCRQKGGEATARANTSAIQVRPPVVSPKKPAAGAKSKFDRNAYHRDYMRDYMRKRRKAQKEQE